MKSLFSPAPLLFLFVAILSLMPFESVRAGEIGVFSERQKQEIRDLVRDYILENPEILFEASERYQQKREAAENEQKKNFFKSDENRKLVFDGGAPVGGNPDGDITVVEFFDYNCGYCKKALSDVLSLIDEDRNVRVIFKDMPILSPASVTAARWALAAEKQGRYIQYHTELMRYYGNKNEDALERLAKKLGLDVAQMKKDAESPEIQKIIDQNMEVAHKLGIGGTPAFIVGETDHGGYIGLDALRKSVQDARLGLAGSGEKTPEDAQEE